MSLHWIHWAHLSATFLTAPLYSLIMVVILLKKRLTQFDALLLSQGVADVLSLLTCDFFGWFRCLGVANKFFWKNRQILVYTMVSLCYYNLNLRCVGIMLISIQRYVTICKGGTKIETLMDKIPCYALISAHWGIAFMTIIPFMALSSMTISHINFDSQENLNVLSSQDYLQPANLTALGCAMITAVISALCYTFLIIYVSQCVPWRKRQAIRLTVQFSGLVLALPLFCGLYAIIRCLPWETAYPLLEQEYVMVNITLSCIHPWTYFIFNGEVRRKVINIARCYIQASLGIE